MRTWNFSRVHSCTDDYAFFLSSKLFGLPTAVEEILILNFFIFVAHPLFWRDSNKINRPALKRSNNSWPLEIHIGLLAALLFYLLQKQIVFCVRPRIKEGKIDLLVWGHCVLEAPLDPPLVVFLNKGGTTIFDKSILCAILFQSLLVYSR